MRHYHPLDPEDLGETGVDVSTLVEQYSEKGTNHGTPVDGTHDEALRAAAAELAMALYSFGRNTMDDTDKFNGVSGIIIALNYIEDTLEADMTIELTEESEEVDFQDEPITYHTPRVRFEER